MVHDIQDTCIFAVESCILCIMEMRQETCLRREAEATMYMMGYDDLEPIIVQIICFSMDKSESVGKTKTKSKDQLTKVFGFCSVVMRYVMRWSRQQAMNDRPWQWQLCQAY